MKKFQQLNHRIPIIFVVVLVIQVGRCDPIPELVAKKSDETLTSKAEEPDVNQQKLKCMWEAYTAMVTGDGSSVKDECLTLFGSSTSPEEEKIKGSFEKPMSPSNEADDLALQLREINSDYQNEIKQETETGGDSNTEDIKESATKVNNKQDVEDGIQTFDEIDSPFVTSLKELNEDFLVIPFKYLKTQFNSNEGPEQALANMNSQLKLNMNAEGIENTQKKSENNKKDDELESKLSDNSASIQKEKAANFQQMLEDIQTRGNTGNEVYRYNVMKSLSYSKKSSSQVKKKRNFDVLRQVKTDIHRLEDDLKSLEGTN